MGAPLIAVAAGFPRLPCYNRLMANRERTYSTHAIVLRRRDHADADRLLTVFTAADGKREFLAKGVRKTASRKAGYLEPFAHTVLQIADGRTWDVITEASMVEAHRHLRNDLESIGRAAYLCELVDRFSSEHDENRPLWELITATLRLLDGIAGHEIPGDPQTLMRWFEMNLLSVAGFQPELFNCLECGAELIPVINFLCLAEGGVFCPACGARRSDVEPLDVDTLKVMRYIQNNNWITLATLKVREPVMRRVESVLQRYLTLLLERQLRSTDFLRRLQHLPSPGE